MTNRLFLGVDGGASNITVVVLDEQQNILYQRTTPGGANYHALGLETIVANIVEAVHEADHRLDVPMPVVYDRAVFGLAGCNFDSDAAILTEALRKSSLATSISQGFSVVNDSRIALRAGLPDGVGIVVIAGTGSNCYGRDADGREAQSGGMDYILSDEGSAYDISLRLLRAVTRSLDGRGESTLLQQRLFEFLHVDNLEELYALVYQRYANKPALASLAKLVSQAAESGDVVAKDILNHSVNELIKMVDAVVEQLSWRDRPVKIVHVGSVFQQHAYLAERIRQELRRVIPLAEFVDPEVSSAVGAARMALAEFAAAQTG